jgi:hypothetical protein
MTRLFALTTALALAIAGYAAAFGADDPCVTVTYTDHIVGATKLIPSAGVITTTVTPIPPSCG